MNYYVELTLIENKKITMYELWSKVYGQLHIAFADNKNNDQKIPFGLSFPEYRFNEKANIGFLGGKVRIFAKSREELMSLNIGQWLERLADHVHIQSIKNVPENITQYAIYKRKQMKGENRVQKDRVRFAGSYAKANNISFDEAMALYQNMSVRETHLPFIQMLSLTNEQRFKLFIEKRVVDSFNDEQLFTTYGLSANSSVPEF